MKRPGSRPASVAPPPHEAEVDADVLDADLLLEWFQAPVAFHRPLIDLVGGNVSAALMLTYVLHFAREFQFGAECASNAPLRGFMRISGEEWKHETGLNRSGQETARRILRERGYLEEQLHGMPAKLYCRVNSDKLFADLRAQASAGMSKAPSRQ